MFRFPYVWSVLIIGEKALERFIREIYFKQICSVRNNVNFIQFFSPLFIVYQCLRRRIYTSQRSWNI